MAATIQHIELPKKPRALDTSGNNNHGKIYSGRGLEFDGVSDSLEGVADINTSYGITNSMTVACWVKFNVVGVAQYAWSIFETTSKGFGLLLAADSALGIVNDINDANSQDIYETDIDINTWYRVIVVVDSLELKTYINGVLLGSGTSIPDGFDSFASRLYIGRRGEASGEFYLNGCMSDFQMWDKVWTADDAAYDYANPESLALNASGSALTEGNLKVWYPMQDGHRGQQSYILDGANTGLNTSGAITLNLSDNGDFDGEDYSNWTLQDAVEWTVNTNSSTSFEATADSDIDGTANASFYIGLKNTGMSANVPVGNYKVTGTISTTSALPSENVALKWYSSGSDHVQTSLSEGDFEVITQTTSANGNSHFIFSTSTEGQNFTLSNVKVTPINDKHHATTVFFGDELIINGSMEANDNWNSFNSVDSNSQSGTQKHSGSYSWTFTPGAASEGIKSDNFTTVVGKTYLASFWVYPDTGTVVKAAVRTGDGNAWSYLGSELTVTQDQWNKVEFQFTETVGGSSSYIAIHSSTDTSGIFYVDDVSIKEVGVASGWTDADQQLDIAQPALQSYNEMAWFDGAADYVSIADHDDFTFGTDSAGGDSAFTVSAWIYPNVAEDFPIVSKDGGSGEREWNFHLNAGGGLEFYAYDDNAPAHIGRKYTTALATGKWHHVVGTYSGNEANSGFTLYVNGSSVDNADKSSGTYVSMEPGTATLDIGKHVAGGKFANGCITGVSVHSAAINAGKVLEIYNEGKELDITTFSGYSAVEGYWRNNGLSTWTDLSTNSHNGTPTSITETLLCPQGIDGSRCSQGFIMNKPRNTSSLNLTNTGQQDGYVDLGSTTIVANDADATFVVWLKPDDTATDNYFLGTGSTDFIKLDSSTAIQINVGSTAHTFTGLTIVAKEWVHVAITRTASDDKFRLLVNGSSSGIGASGAINNAFDFRYVGARNHAEYTFRGQLDGFLYYDDKLDDTEVLRNYKATKGSHRN